MRPGAWLVGVAVLLATRAVAADDVVTGRLTVEGGNAVAAITVAPGWHINGNAPHDAFLVPTSLEVAAPEGVKAGAVRYPPAVERVLAFSAGKSLALFEGDLRITVPLEGAISADGPALRARLRYQACNDTTCLPPRTIELTASRKEAGAGASSARAAGGGEVASWIARWGLVPTLLWVGVLGMALNLTPCVYPLIGVTVAFFGGRSGTHSAQVWRAVAYVLGICITFSALGVAAALTGSLFGAAMQQPVVLVGMATLMLALALANFGLYRVRMPQGLMRWAGRSGEGAAGALFMGLTMGVVAAPCIGPVVVGLLVFVGAQQSVALGWALFFALGVGMGLPYVLLAMAAGRLRRLPRGGFWLEWMERLFAFLLLAAALHFVTPLLPPGIVAAGWALLLIGGGAVQGFMGAGGTPAIRLARKIAGVAVAVAGLGMFLVVEGQSPLVWVPYSDRALADAVAAGRPVFIDFQAVWCLPCREMERTTFRDPGFLRSAERFAMLKADVTSQDDAAAALMQRYAVPGVPTYVLLGPDGTERRRFVGFVAADEMVSAMHEVGGRG